MLPATTRPVGSLEAVACTPWLKDYDAEGSAPSAWPDRFDTSGWHVFLSSIGAARTGAAVVIHGDPGIDMLEGRTDLALIWDLRVSPAYRRRGVGRFLIDQMAAWARARGCSELKVETQDVNVPACRLYHACGFELRHVEPGAYPDLPDEAMLLWYRPL